MKLEHAPLPDGTKNETDTDKLPDVPASLLEAAEKFRLECNKYKRQFFLTVNIDDSVEGKSYTFWSFLSGKMTPPSLLESGERRTLSPEEANAFYRMIHNGVLGVSGGRFMVIGVPFTRSDTEKPNDGQGTTGAS